jgi:hypothetical protein
VRFPNCWNGRNGHDSRGEYLIANKSVQEGRFAALELTDTGDVKASVGYPLCDRPRIGCELARVKPLS